MLAGKGAAKPKARGWMYLDQLAAPVLARYRHFKAIVTKACYQQSLLGCDENNIFGNKKVLARVIGSAREIVYLKCVYNIHSGLQAKEEVLAAYYRVFAPQGDLELKHMIEDTRACGPPA